MSGNNFNGAHLNPDAPIFEGSKTLPVPEIKQLTQIIANQNEDIVSLKLINFEAQIEINKKDEEIERLREIIENYQSKNDALEKSLQLRINICE